MRLRRTKPQPGATPPPAPDAQAPAAPADPPTAVEGQPAQPADPAAATTPAPAAPATEGASPTPPATAPTVAAPAGSKPAGTDGPGPVPGTTGTGEPMPPITGAHPVARTATPAAAPVSETDGLRAWLADLDRKLGTRSYAGAAAMVLALAASIVAIVLAIDARDNSAGLDDLARVEAELAESVSAETEAGQTALTQVNELSTRLTALEERVTEIDTADTTTEERITVIEDDIDDLRQQITDLDGGGSAP